MNTQKDTVQTFADSLTGEQAIKLYQIAHPLTDEQRAELDALSLDEIAEALDG